MPEVTFGERLRTAVPDLPAEDVAVVWGRSRRRQERRQRMVGALVVTVALLAGAAVMLGRNSHDAQLGTVSSPSPWVGGGRWERVADGPGFPTWVHAWAGPRLAVFGGRTGVDEWAVGTPAGAVFDPATSAWEQVAGMPSVHVQAAAWTGAEVLVWGIDPATLLDRGLSDVAAGASPERTRSLGALYDPEKRTWRAVPNAPNLAFGEGSWDGLEWLVIGITPAGAAVALAYSPRRSTWRNLPVPPGLKPNTSPFHVRSLQPASPAGDMVLQVGRDIWVHRRGSGDWQHMEGEWPTDAFSEGAWTGDALVHRTFVLGQGHQPLYRKLDPATGRWTPVKRPPDGVELSDPSVATIDHRAVFMQNLAPLASPDQAVPESDRLLYGYDARTDTWSTLLPIEHPGSLSWNGSELWDIRFDGVLHRFVGP